MPRVKRGVMAHKRRKNLLADVKGYIGSRSTKYRAAKVAYLKAQKYAFRDRKARKREFRSLWIIRLNAALRLEGLVYSRFINALKNKKIELDRKILADLAVNNPEIFKAVIAATK